MHRTHTHPSLFLKPRQEQTALMSCILGTAQAEFVYTLCDAVSMDVPPLILNSQTVSLFPVF